MNYQLIVKIEPEKYYIYSKCKIENVSNYTFYINENFHILSVKADGREISYQLDKNAPHPPFDMVSRPITFDTKEADIEIEYEGCIPDVIWDVNQINEDIIELASYAGWYPKPGLDSLFTFDLRLSLPSGYEIASNGNIEGYSHIFSNEPQSDIAVFASSKVKRVIIDNSAIHMEFLCPETVLPIIPGRSADIAKANSFYTEKYGEIKNTSSKHEIISVLRPYGGWGYKRGKTTFISYEKGLNETHYTLDFHELAHGWWSIANTNTNDWINEGGAEFSSYAAAKYIYGSEYAKTLEENYLNKIKNTVSTHSIIETNSSSEDRYLNHYIKTAYMYITAQKLFGEDRVFNLLKNLYQEFAGTKCASANDFLDLCDLDMRAFFYELLYSRDWSSIKTYFHL